MGVFEALERAAVKPTFVNRDPLDGWVHTTVACLAGLTLSALVLQAAHRMAYAMFRLNLGGVV